MQNDHFEERVQTPGTYLRAVRRAFGATTLLVLAVTVTGCGMGGSDEEPPSNLPTSARATVSVDYSQQRGKLLRTERFNNLHTTSVFPEQRASDVAYLNSQGMHGSIYRVWLNSPNEAAVPPCIEDVSTPPAPEKPCTLNPPFKSYMTDAEAAADKLLGNLRLNGSPGFITAGGPDAAVPLIERTLLAVKKAHPRLTYIEAWNEPDEPGTVIKPDQVYEYHVAVYRAVNSINTKLGTTVPNYVPMQVGGPALYYFNRTWFATFFDAFAADRDPNKRLDFISYHAYVDIDAKGTTKPLKSNPRSVAGQRAEIDAMLQARGISTSIPSYVTETGAYPGPLCDVCDGTDFVRSAAGVASLHYWLANEPKTIPFNWLTRQRAGGLKDQFVTKDASGPYVNAARQQLWQPLNPVPKNIFTPFGNMLLMKSMMKDNMAAAQSDNLSSEGIGIYSLASHDSSGASIMFWNYQGCPGFSSGNPPTNKDCPNGAFDVQVHASNLPDEIRNRQVIERVFLIDQTRSNFYANPSQASLQQISLRSVYVAGEYRSTWKAAANAMYLVVLEPAN